MYKNFWWVRVFNFDMINEVIPISSAVERSLLLWLACVLIYTWEYIWVIFFNAYFTFCLSFFKRSLHSLWSVEMGECWMVLITEVFVFAFLLDFWFIIFLIPTLSFALIFLRDFSTSLKMGEFVIFFISQNKKDCFKILIFIILIQSFFYIMRFFRFILF